VSTVLYNRTPPVARITINRPEAMNAFDLATARELARRLEQFDRDAKLRVAILTGAGKKSFCAGADLKKMHGGSHAGGIGELWDHERQYRLGQAEAPGRETHHRGDQWLLPGRGPRAGPRLRHPHRLHHRVLRMPGGALGDPARIRRDAAPPHGAAVGGHGDAADR
jgi:hypothetical protein